MFAVRGLQKGRCIERARHQSISSPHPIALHASISLCSQALKIARFPQLCPSHKEYLNCFVQKKQSVLLMISKQRKFGIPGYLDLRIVEKRARHLNS